MPTETSHYVALAGAQFSLSKFKMDKKQNLHDFSDYTVGRTIDFGHYFFTNTKTKRKF